MCRGRVIAKVTCSQEVKPSHKESIDDAPTSVWVEMERVFARGMGGKLFAGQSGWSLQLLGRSERAPHRSVNTDTPLTVSRQVSTRIDYTHHPFIRHFALFYERVIALTHLLPRNSTRLVKQCLLRLPSPTMTVLNLVSLVSHCLYREWWLKILLRSPFQTSRLQSSASSHVRISRTTINDQQPQISTLRV